MTSNLPGDFLIANLSGSGIGAAENDLSSADPIPGAEAADAAPVPEGTSLGDMLTSGKKRKASNVKKDKEIGCEWGTKIHEFTDKAGISFEYPEKKKKALVKTAKERRDKRMEKSEGDHWDCSMCGEMFFEEHELKDHFDSEGHLLKVREKSESKTSGDLNTFHDFCKEMRSHPPRRTYPIQDTLAISYYSEGQQSFLGKDNEAASVNIPYGYDVEDFSFCNDIATDDDMLRYIDTTLKGQELKKDDKDATPIEKLNQLRDENRKLLDENKDLRKEVAELKHKLDPETSRAKLEEYIVELKKNEIKGDLKAGQFEQGNNKFEYKFESREYYRMMSIVLEDCSSVEEREKNLVLCCLKIKRGKYDKSQNAQIN